MLLISCRVYGNDRNHRCLEIRVVGADTPLFPARAAEDKALTVCFGLRPGARSTQVSLHIS